MSELPSSVQETDTCIYGSMVLYPVCFEHTVELRSFPVLISDCLASVYGALPVYSRISVFSCVAGYQIQA